MERLQRNPAAAVGELILEALQREDPSLNGLAMEAVVAIGRDAVPTLVAEVLATDDVPYQLRLLRVIEEIGEIPDPADHLEIFSLVRSRDSRVRLAAARVIWAVGPHGPRRAAAPQAADVLDILP
jgi:hypothetical protein